jgi:hypothetical protein
VAELLVRLNDLEQLKNVWLDSASVQDQGFRGRTAVKYSAISEIVIPSSTATQSSSVVPPPAETP